MTRPTDTHWTYEALALDPDQKRVEIFTLAERRLVKAAEHASGEVASLVALPGFSAPLDRIFGNPPGRRPQ
jgi:hypothetical protein